MDGVLVVDKPQGLTSHDVVALARRALGETRLGHTGTLDPLATGVLPLASGRATRLVQFLMASEKEYEARIRFGLTTDTYDVTGQEVATSGAIPPRAAVEAALGTLTGEYLQAPPAYSAKKIGGRRAFRSRAPLRLCRRSNLILDGLLEFDAKRVCNLLRVGKPSAGVVAGAARVERLVPFPIRI